jgi:hypothetical protein
MFPAITDPAIGFLPTDRDPLNSANLQVRTDAKSEELGKGTSTRPAEPLPFSG